MATYNTVLPFDGVYQEIGDSALYKIVENLHPSLTVQLAAQETQPDASLQGHPLRGQAYGNKGGTGSSEEFAADLKVWGKNPVSNAKDVMLVITELS